MDEHTAPAPSIAEKQAAAKPVRPKRRVWLKLCGLVLILLGVGVWFAPTIVAVAVLGKGVPKSLIPMFKGEIAFSGISLGWLSPIVIKDLKVDDEQGQPLITAQQISTSHSLWELATNSSNLGTVTIIDPVVHVSLRDAGSNLEDQLASFSGGTPSNKPSPDVTIEIENAQVILEHKESNQQSTFDQISVRAVTRQGAVDEVDLSMGIPTAKLAKTPPHESDLSDWLTAHYGSATDLSSLDQKNPSEVKTAVLRASQWKLNRLAPAIARIQPKAQADGEFNADASITLTPNASGFDFDWNGTVSIEKLLVAGIAALKQDRLALDQLALSGRAATTQGRLAMNNLKLVADVGEFSATGDIPLDGNSNKSAIELVQSLLSDEDYHIAGNVDLKKLAAMLPQTLRIRDGIEITGGDVKVQLVGADSNGVRHWSGAAGIVGLTAVNQGQTIPWDKPLVVKMSAHRESDSIVVDSMECKSDFLQIKGSGTLEDAKFAATGDLTRLLENLEQFVDLGIDQMSGQMTANGELRRTDENHIGLKTRILLDKFAFALSKDQVWHEDHLELSIVADGLANPESGLTRIDQGEIHLISGQDTFDARLKKPVELAAKSPSYEATAAVKGNLTTWQNRLRPFVAINDWKLAGTMDLQTTVAATAQQIDVSRLSLGLQKVEAAGPGWVIQEQDVKVATAGQWTVAAQKWVSPRTSLAGSSLSVDIDNLECALGPKGLARLVGTASYRADLKQISHWKNLALEKPAYYLIGSLSGTANLQQNEGVIAANLDTQIEKLVVAGLNTPAGGQPAWVALWKEPQLKVGARGTYDVTADKLVLDSSSLDVDGVSVSAKGKLDDCLTRQGIDLTGELGYDWERLVKRFGDLLGKNIQLTGKDRRPFSVKGSLASLSNPPTVTPTGKTNASTVSFRPGSDTSVPAQLPATGGLADLSAQAGVGWSTANVYGIVAGPGDVSMKLDQGVCQFAPLDLVVNEGKLHITPTVHLETDPYVLVLPKEKVIDQIRLSPELCRGWLKFVVPTLADSAEVEGKLSLDLAGASLPLFDPATGSVDGTLAVHQVQVRPGPLALQIVGAIDQVQALLLRRQAGELSKEQVWMQMPEQQIPFKLEQGRVYHEGMTFMVKNVSVKTSGSVGTDETIRLVAHIAIRDEWLGDNKVFAGLKGQTVQIPINGTLSRPQLDPRILANLTKQFGGSALEGLIQDKVGDKLDGAVKDGLDKLFRKKK